MGASPDGTVNCECCGFGVVEVKCPYSCKLKSVLEATAESTFFLVHNDEITNLKTNHACILLSNTNTNEILQCFLLLSKSGVLPELLGRWYSKAPVSSASGSGSRALHQTEDISPQPYSLGAHAKVLCHGKQGEEGEMIACDHEQCSILSQGV